MSLLEGVHVFEGVPLETLRRLEQGATVFEVGNDDALFAEDDPADVMFAIVGGPGSVRIGAVDRHSKKLMVEVFKAGDVFGEIGVIDGAHRTAAAEVEGRVRLVRIGRANLMAAMGEAPQLGINFARLLAGRLRRTFALLQDATFETVEVRLARQVLYLAQLQGRRGPTGTVLGSRLKHADLADLLGTTTRSVITVLNAWRTAEIVHYDTRQAQLTILDEAALRALCGP